MFNHFLENRSNVCSRANTAPIYILTSEMCESSIRSQVSCTLWRKLLSCNDAVQVTLGKGGTWLLPFLCSKYQLQSHEVGIVGDRLDTDIALGKLGKLRTILPLTGVSTLADLLAATDEQRPDFVVTNLAALAGIDTQIENALM